MPASQIRRGSAMEHLAKDMVKEFKADPRCQSATSSKRTFCYGTMCSGSEITGVGLNMLQCVCASNGIEWKFEQAYACEIESKKRDWILEVTEDEDCCVYEDFIQFHPISIIALISVSTWIFIRLVVFFRIQFISSQLFFRIQFHPISQDLTKLWTGRVTCHGLNRECPVRRTEGSVLGVSCKDLARSNPKRWLLHGNVLSSEKSPGKTADTFWGFIKMLDSPQGGSPTWAILENSDLLLDDNDGSKEWETMRDALGVRGFKSRPILVDSVYFGVPMHRRRSYLVCRVFVYCVGIVPSSAYADWQALFDDLLSKCRRFPPCLTEVLLKPGNKYIEYEFNQAWSKGDVTDS